MAGDVLYIGDDPEGPACQVCGEVRDDSPTVECERCQTPHHRDCWDYVGRCSTFACGGSGYRRADGSTGGTVMVRTVTLPSPGLAGEDASPVVIDEHGRATLDAIPLRAPRPPVLRDAEGYELDATAPHVPLDLDTPFESLLQWASVAFLGLGYVLGVPKRGPVDWGTLQFFLVLASLAMGMRLGTECLYVLDNQLERIFYATRVFGFQVLWSVGSFSEIQKVGLVSRVKRSKHSTWNEYAVVLHLPGGRVAEVSPETREVGRAAGFARCLARHLDCEAETDAKAAGTLPDGWWTVTDLRVSSASRWGGLPTVFHRVRAGWWAYVALLVTALAMVF